MTHSAMAEKVGRADAVDLARAARRERAPS